MSYTRYKAHVGNRYTLELIRNTSSLSAPAREVVLMGSEPLIVEREDRSPLQSRWSTRCTMKLQSEVQYAFEHISRDEKNWYVKLFAPSQPNTPVFTGIIEQGLYEEQYEQLPYEVTLTATCGLKKLDDYYLDVDALPLNEKVLTPLYAVVKQCLKKARDLEINFVGEVGAWLTTSYIDPSGYRTNEDGERSSQKMGEVLDGILSSLGLVVYLHNNTWRVEEAVSSFPRETILFETKERPIYTTPSLSVEGKYGSVRINLPQEELDSASRFAPVSLPLKVCTSPSPYLDNQPILHANCISATQPIAERASLPTTLERSRGMQVRLPYQKEEAICIAIPYRAPADAKSITFEVELGFGKNDINSPNGDEWDIQSVCEMKITDQVGRNTFMALAGHAPWCYYASSLGLEYPFDVRKEESEELREEKSKTSFQGKSRSGEAFFSSSWAYMPSVNPQEIYNWHSSGAFNRIANGHLPWCRVRRSNFRNGKMHPFSFTVLLPFHNMIDTHTKKRWTHSIENNGTDYPFYPELKNILAYIPFRFWEAGKEKNSDKKETVNDFLPSEVTVGRVSVRYNMREGEEYNRFLLCDRGTDYVREGEEINLSLTTRIEGVDQKGTIKGWLYNAVGEQLREVGRMNLVERAAKNFFAVYGETQDRVTLRTPAKGPYSPIQQYRLKGRPGHTYYIAGSRWDVVGEEEELSLFEVPHKINEEVEYDL